MRHYISHVVVNSIALTLLLCLSAFTPAVAAGKEHRTPMTVGWKNINAQYVRNIWWPEHMIDCKSPGYLTPAIVDGDSGYMVIHQFTDRDRTAIVSSVELFCMDTLLVKPIVLKPEE